MSKIYNQRGEIANCSFCHKELDTNMGLEYSDEMNTLCCSRDCAAMIYYNSMRSHPVNKNSLKKLGYKIMGVK